MGFFRCPINHELIDTGIEQELSFMFGPAREIWESAQIRIDRSIQTC